MDEIKEITSISDAIHIVYDPDTHLSAIFDRVEEKQDPDRWFPIPFGLWFRGQSRASYKLIPSILRPPQMDGRDSNNGNAWYDESMMIQHFRQRNPSYEQSYRIPFDLLCLLQHYRFPTRLLDWTESILIALYFAVETDDDEDGKVFALNARRLNSQSRLHDPQERYICGSESIDVTIRSAMASARRFKDLRYAFKKNSGLRVIEDINIGRYRKAYENMGICWFQSWVDGNLETNHPRYAELMKLLASPVAVFPNRLNPRMSSQLSMVLVFGGKKTSPLVREPQDAAELLPRFDDDEHKLEALDKASVTKFLRPFVVRKKNKPRIREQLRCIGMHEAALFPELDHIGNFVRKEWTFFGPAPVAAGKKRTGFWRRINQR
jgi:hypothetical protein